MRLVCQFENQSIPFDQVPEEDCFHELKWHIRKYLRNRIIHPMNINTNDISLFTLYNKQKQNVTCDVQLMDNRHHEINVHVKHDSVPVPIPVSVPVPVPVSVTIPQTLGHYITNRKKGLLDNLAINLDLFSPNSRTPRNMNIVAELWKQITDNSDGDWVREKTIQGSFRYCFTPDPDCFIKIKIRQDENDKSRNIIVGETQLGKSIDIIILSWFAQKLGFLVIDLVRNNGGSDTIHTIRKGFELIKKTGINYSKRI